MGTVLTPEQKALARRLLCEGKLTNAEIAARLGISNSLLYQLLPSPRTAATGRRKALPAWYDDAINLLTNEDITASEVARRLGVDKNNIYYHFPRNVRDELKKKGSQKP